MQVFWNKSLVSKPENSSPQWFQEEVAWYWFQQKDIWLFKSLKVDTRVGVWETIIWKGLDCMDPLDPRFLGNRYGKDWSQQV